MDLYLKFTSAEEAEPLLYNIIETHIGEDGLPVSADIEGNYPEGSTTKTEKQPKFLNLDIIGDIYKPTGETTEAENGMVVPVMEKLDGYHVNIRPVGEDVSALEPYAVVPANPVRVWG